MDNDETFDETVDEVDTTNGNVEVVDMTLIIYLAIGAVTFLITFMLLMYLFW